MVCSFGQAAREKAMMLEDAEPHHEVPARPFCGLGRQSVEEIMFWAQLWVPPHCVPMLPW